MTGNSGHAEFDQLPAYLTAMVRRRPPGGAGVIAGSTPVVAFGDSGTAWAATLGINPSRREFVDEQGRLLDSDNRRLATLRSLGAASLNALTDVQVAAVLADCAAYFGRQPYRFWFDPLDRLLRDGLGASYYNGTACHLDLVQWATNPVWGEVADPKVRRALIEDGLPHLRAQLAASPQIRFVLCNGRQVIDQVLAAGLAELHEEGVIRNGPVTCRPYAGAGIGGGRARWLGWSANLQSGRGVSASLKHDLADWLGQQARGEGHLRARPAGPAEPIGLLEADSGYLPRGLRVTGKAELVAVLASWLERSGAATIGDVGSFGRTAWVRVDLGGTEVVLNADTKRAAVESFVRASAAQPDRPWLVVASQRGHATKVLPSSTTGPAPGWYAYLTRPGTAGQLI